MTTEAELDTWTRHDRPVVSIQFVGLTFFSILGLCLWVYRGALNGAFISDDVVYIVKLADGYPFNWSFVLRALDPTGVLKYELWNYAPFYAITSRAEAAFFGPNTFAYHLVNVIFHSLNATLLVALIRSAGIRTVWALIAGLFFALHPANVEAVAWISQLRSILSLGCALGSLLALSRRPALATVLFASALLFKVSAMFALPVAFVLAWVARNDSTRAPISLRWLFAWVGVFSLYAIPQFGAFHALGQTSAPGFADLGEQIRGMSAIGSRYLAMAASSYGVSAYHEPEPVRSWLSPWWLASIPIAVVLVVRIQRSLARATPCCTQSAQALSAMPRRRASLVSMCAQISSRTPPGLMNS